MNFPMRRIALLLLPLLVVAAVYCLMIVAGNNGLFRQIEDIVKEEQPIFPGSESPLLRKYAGVAAIDRQLTVLVTFFGPVVQRINASLNVFSLFGLGQFGGAWTLLMMESFRYGNSGMAVSFLIIYGFFVQNVSFAISTPVYLFIHLLTSPTSKPLTSTHARSILPVTTYDLAILPISVTLGYIIPSLLTIFPGSPVASPSHQYLVAFWQAFPLWTIIVQWFLKLLCVLILGQETSANAEKSPITTTSIAYLKYAGRVYTFILVFCMATHLPAVVISLLPPNAIPDSMHTLAYLSRSSFNSTFIPPLPLGLPIRDMAEGVHIFLQWDMYIGSAAGLLWAIVLYQNASAARKESVSSSMSRIFKTATWIILGGPVAAWTVLVWERDEIMMKKVKV